MFTLYSEKPVKSSSVNWMGSFRFATFSVKIGNYRASLELVKLLFKKSRFPDNISFGPGETTLILFRSVILSGGIGDCSQQARFG